MNSIISNDNLGNWKFLRNDLLSIFAADDSRLLEKYDNDEQMDKLFDKLAEDYLDGWAVSGFCIDEEDNVSDVLELIMALSSASILKRHPFRWEPEFNWEPDSFLNNDDFKHAPPTLFMIDTSNAGENYTNDFVKTLDAYFTIMGYGHMDIVYENRLVYINKCKYAAKVKNASDIKDGISDKYVVKFEPYSFSLFTDSIDLTKRMVYGVLINELEIARCSNTPTPWKLIYTGNKQYDDEVFSFISSMSDRFKKEMYVSRIYESGSGVGLHHPILEVTAFNNVGDDTKPLEITFTYKFEQGLK